jgi:molecular chaperone HtpG
MTEAIDEYCVSQLNSYKEHNLVNITRQNIDLPESEDEKKDFEAKKINYKNLCESIQKALGSSVSSVTVSNRLVKEPCCISVGQHGWTANMEKIMKAQAMSDNSMINYMQSQRCFEINPEHNIIKSLYNNINNSTNDMDIGTSNLIHLLYETALHDAGFTVTSPRNYAHRVYSMVELGLGFVSKNIESELNGNDDLNLPELNDNGNDDDDLNLPELNDNVNENENVNVNVNVNENDDNDDLNLPELNVNVNGNEL